MSIEVLLLGNAQDAGLPQIGCHCNNCLAVFEKKLSPDFATSIAIVDHEIEKYWLVDATPDMRNQLEITDNLWPDYSLAGILITHAHIGHYTGLMFLGRESMNSHQLPVFASSLMCQFISEHAPWKQLQQLGNIKMIEVSHEQKFKLSANLSVTPHTVPHRGEYSDTFAFTFIGNLKKLFFCPDIDHWNQWDKDLQKVANNHDINLLDATFYSGDELPGRDMREIPHPLVIDTLRDVSGVNTEIVLVHLNHTNPLWQPGKEQDFVSSADIKVGKRGDSWQL